MTGTPFYLRTDTREAMDAALLAAGLPTESTDWCCVDHIGALVTGGVYGSDCEELVAPTMDGRWHTNVLPMRDLTAEQLALLPIITPSSPSRTFA